MTKLDCRDPPSPCLPHFPRRGHWLPKSCLAAHPENEDDRELSLHPLLLRWRPLGRVGIGRVGCQQGGVWAERGWGTSAAGGVGRMGVSW